MSIETEIKTAKETIKLREEQVSLSLFLGLQERIRDGAVSRDENDTYSVVISDGLVWDVEYEGPGYVECSYGPGGPEQNLYGILSQDQINALVSELEERFSKEDELAGLEDRNSRLDEVVGIMYSNGLIRDKENS